MIDPRPVRASLDDDGFVQLEIYSDALWFEPGDVERALVRLTPEDAEQLISDVRAAVAGID